jgi:hypothetical protein
MVMYGQLNENSSRNLNEKKNREVFIGMTVTKHNTWFSIKSEKSLALQPCDYNRPEGAGC